MRRPIRDRFLFQIHRLKTRFCHRIFAESHAYFLSDNCRCLADFQWIGCRQYRSVYFQKSRFPSENAPELTNRFATWLAANQWFLV